MNKAAVIRQIRDLLDAELEGLVQMTAMSRDEATGGQSKPENKYDTRALEASYLAAGQGQRLEELRRLTSWYQTLESSHRFDRVAEGALVQTETEEGAVQWLFIAPAGGTRVQYDNQNIQVVSLRSPLGSALAGCEADDAATVESPQGRIEVEVLAIL